MKSLLFSIHLFLSPNVRVFFAFSCSIISPKVSMAISSKFSTAILSTSPHPCCRKSLPLRQRLPPQKSPSLPSQNINVQIARPIGNIVCKATEVSVAEESPASGDGRNWVPVVPLAALPRGERRVIIQDRETILLLWYKDAVFAIENRSPAEGAYSEGLLNAKLTQISLSISDGWLTSFDYELPTVNLEEKIKTEDGCIVCPTTDSTFDLRTGEIKEWYPNNPVLRVLTPALRTLFVYPVKTDPENIYISMGGGLKSGVSAEIVFSGKAQPGMTASDVNVDEVRMVVDEDVGGFGFTGKNELINGKAAIIGFLLLLDFELLTGKGLLRGTGFLDFLYAASRAFDSS